MKQSVEFVFTKERVRHYTDLNRYEFQPRVSKTAEQDFLVFFQKLAFRFLCWSGALVHPQAKDTTFERFTLDTGEFTHRLLKQQEELFNQNRRPVRLLIGADDFQELMGSPRIQEIMRFTAPIGFGREILGLKVEVIPWMRGMVTLSE